MRHAGMHWPANAGGEHPDRETIYQLPGVAHGALLICADAARFWYAEARSRCPLVVWRAIPRQGKLPAQLGWDTRRVADEVLNLWSEQPHGGDEWFLPLNELQFDREAGESWRGYAYMAARLAALRVELRARLPARVRLMFPAWVPSDDLGRAPDWLPEAARWDGVCLHAYGPADAIRDRYNAYRALVGPSTPILIGEWNGPDEAATLGMFADLAAADAAFLGATYYIWETNNAGEHDLSVWSNAARLALFQNPPPLADAPSESDQPMSDAWEFWTAGQIAAASGCPADAITEHWPRIVAQLDLCGENDRPTQAAVIGTTAIETASTFRPIHEYGTPADWAGYSGGAAFAGRGFIQITHDYNYRAYSDAVNDLWQAGGAVDLVARPDDALDPDVAAAVLALYVRDHKTAQGYSIPDAARAGDWEWVRRLVQGGTNGLPRLVSIVAALGLPLAPGPATPAVAGFNPAVPPDAVIRQRNDWTCAVRSVYWSLWAIGAPVTYGDSGPNDVYDWLVPAYDDESVGLHDHTGAGLVAALAAHGYRADHAYPVTLDEVRARAGRQPVLIGGDRWGPAGHWVGVRGVESDGTLVLANPAGTYQGLGNELRDSFDRLGPFALVWVDGPVAPAPAPETDAETVARLVNALAYVCDSVGDALATVDDGAVRANVAELRRVRVEQIGARP